MYSLEAVRYVGAAQTLAGYRCYIMAHDLKPDSFSLVGGIQNYSTLIPHPTYMPTIGFTVIHDEMECFAAVYEM